MPDGTDFQDSSYINNKIDAYTYNNNRYVMYIG